MILTLDVETTFDVDEENKITSSPFNDNTLVSVGYKVNDNPVKYLCFYHRDEPPTPNAKNILQDVLDKANVLVGHNIKFDYSWLIQCGFTYDKKLHDTMVMEYIMARGVKWGFSLEE